MPASEIRAQVTSIRQLFGELQAIDVPWYQRTYKWDNERVQEIFHDVIFYCRDGADRGAFLGSVVFAPGESPNAWEIIDGQQRTTTLSVVLAVLAHDLKKTKGKERLADEIFALLHRKDGSPLLQPKEIDLPVFTEIVDEERKGVLREYEKGNKEAVAFLANSILFKAYRQIQSMISHSLSEMSSQSGITIAQATERLALSMLDSIRMVRILAEDNSDGIKIFKSLNATGMPLDDDELIKSAFYMHAKLSPAARSIVQELWEGKFGICTTFDKSSLRCRFLRSFWLSSQSFLRGDDLFDAYNKWAQEQVEKLGAEKAFKEISDVMGRNLVAYEKMEDAADEFSFLKVQNSMGSVMFRTILLAVHDLMFEGAVSKRIEAVKRVGYVLESVLIRMSVCGQTTNVLERSVSDLAISIRKGSLGMDPDTLEKEVRKFFQRQQMNVPRDQAFKTLFLSSVVEKGRNKKWLPIFYRLNYALKFPGARGSIYADTPNFSGWKIEPVKVPLESPSNAYCKELGFRNGQDYLAAVSSPGNFVIVTSDGDNLPVNKGISPKSADAEGIADRNDKLADLAAEIWPL
jgi:uncharacterized protein with ParB-like and HNH nuclease domain